MALGNLSTPLLQDWEFTCSQFSMGLLLSVLSGEQAEEDLYASADLYHGLALFPDLA